MNTKMNAKSVSVIGVLAAMEMIFARFLTIHTWNLKIGFSFVPVAVAAILYGSVAAGLVAAIGDVFGAILFPAGAYFPGFTLTAFLTGAIFGLFLHKSQSAGHVLLSVISVQLVNLFLNSFWISFLYGSPYLALLLVRIYQAAAMAVVQAVCILLIARKVVPALRRER